MSAIPVVSTPNFTPTSSAAAIATNIDAKTAAADRYLRDADAGFRCRARL